MLVYHSQIVVFSYCSTMRSRFKMEGMIRDLFFRVHCFKNLFKSQPKLNELINAES